MDMNEYRNLTDSQSPDLQLIQRTKLRMQESFAPPTAAGARRSIRISRRVVAIAAAVAMLTITTAVAAGLPGYIRSLFAGNLTVNEYESGMLPNIDLNDPDNIDRFGVFVIDGEVISEYEFTELDSLEAAQALLGRELLLPEHLEFNEKPVLVRSVTHNAGTATELWYMNGYRDETGMLVSDGSSFFILVLTDVGDKQITFDVMGDSYETTVNGHEAIWHGPENGGLYWIQDGFFIQLLPCDFETGYIMKVAESLAPATTLPEMGSPRNFVYQPYYTEDGEYVDNTATTAELAYAIGIFETSEGATRPYYTRDRLAQHFREVGSEGQLRTDTRQTHIIPGNSDSARFGAEDLCNNTYYFSIGGERVCSSCGYIFTAEQNSEIGWAGTH